MVPKNSILIKVDIIAIKIGALGEVRHKLYAPWLRDINILYDKTVV